MDKKISITRDELQAIITMSIASAMKKAEEYVYGVPSLAEALGYHRITMQKYKERGIIPFEFFGPKKIRFNVEEVRKALMIYAERKKGGRKCLIK